MAEMNLGHVHLEPPFLGPWCIGCARGLLNDPMSSLCAFVALDFSGAGVLPTDDLPVKVMERTGSMAQTVTSCMAIEDPCSR